MHESSEEEKNLINRLFDQINDRGDNNYYTNIENIVMQLADFNVDLAVIENQYGQTLRGLAQEYDDTGLDEYFTNIGVMNFITDRAVELIAETANNYNC